MCHVCGFICYLRVELKLMINTRSLSKSSIVVSAPIVAQLPLLAFRSVHWGWSAVTAQWSGRGPTRLRARFEIGVGWKIGVTWSQKGSFKMAATELGYKLTKLSFWLSLLYDMIYQFLGMEAKNYKFGMFCQQCHPSVALGDADNQPRNASRIHTCHLFMS